MRPFVTQAASATPIADRFDPDRTGLGRARYLRFPASGAIAAAFIPVKMP
jgi:hypothetical protein